jgi:hypothetical protein
VTGLDDAERQNASRGAGSLRRQEARRAGFEDGAQDCRAQPIVHDGGLVYVVLAPWRNAAEAAGLLMRKFWELNHTNPSSP